VKPIRDTADPRRANCRRDNVDAQFAKSKIEKLEPRRPMPHKDSVEPKRL